MTVAGDLGARETPQRRAVLNVLTASDDHPTAAEITERVRARAPGIGAATVYRTLSLLVETGRARELLFRGEISARYDANVATHHHLVCIGCGRMIDVTPRLPESVLGGLAADTGFEITGFDLRFQGRCPNCAASSPIASQST